MAARTITITSATKSFNIPALRCAVMHFGTPALKERFFARVPGASARLARRHRRRCHDRRLGRRPALARRDHGAASRRTATGWRRPVGAELPGVTLRRPEATYLAWLDCSALGLPISAGQFFLDRARVGLNFGETFGAPYARFARLNYATPAPVLREIVGRMAEAVRRRWSPPSPPGPAGTSPVDAVIGTRSFSCPRFQAYFEPFEQAGGPFGSGGWRSRPRCAAGSDDVSPPPVVRRSGEHPQVKTRSGVLPSNCFLRQRTSRHETAPEGANRKG